MKIVLSARGSRGDVYPMIAIAAGLKAAGHDVALCVPRLFDELAGRRQLPGPRYTEDSQALMQGFGSGWGAAREALSWLRRSVDEGFEVLLDATEDADLLVTSTNEVPPPSVATYRRIPHFRVTYAPMLPGSHPPPLLPWQWFPGPINRLAWRALNGSVRLLVGSRLNHWRGRLGLEPVGAMGPYFSGQSHTLLAVSPALCPPDPDWTYRYSYTGYCHSEDEGALDPGLQRFLDDGPPPVYIGFGSACVKDPTAATARLFEAVLRADLRAIVAGGWTGLGQREVPRYIHLVRGDVPHATLFPHLAAVVHHGGSGTVHNAARAGLPQLLMPQIADQYYWADRIHTLGLGPAPIPAAHMGLRRLRRALDRLCRDPGYRTRAAGLSHAIRAERGVERTVAAITGVEAQPFLATTRARRPTASSRCT